MVHLRTKRFGRIQRWTQTLNEGPELKRAITPFGETWYAGLLGEWLEQQRGRSSSGTHSVWTWQCFNLHTRGAHIRFGPSLSHQHNTRIPSHELGTPGQSQSFNLQPEPMASNLAMIGVGSLMS